LARLPTLPPDRGVVKGRKMPFGERGELSQVPHSEVQVGVKSLWTTPQRVAFV
jgi:hypothetical protein